MSWRRIFGVNFDDGRRWWYLGEGKSFTIEWAPRFSWSVSFHIGDRDGRQGRGIGFHVGWLYVSLSGIGPRTGGDGIRMPEERFWRLSYHSEAFWIDWAHDPWNGSRTVSRRGRSVSRYLDTDLYNKHLTGGWYAVWHWKDWLLGRAAYSTRILANHPQVEVAMPEGRYKASAQEIIATWKRPRWRWPVVMRRLQLEIPGGIPMPGNGENAWDCGDDATFGVTMGMRRSETVHQTIAQFALGLVKERQRIASLSWQPKEEWAMKAWAEAATTS